MRFQDELSLLGCFLTILPARQTQRQWATLIESSQNRSQKYSSVSQTGATAFPWRDPDPPAASRGKGVNYK